MNKRSILASISTFMVSLGVVISNVPGLHHERENDDRYSAAEQPALSDVFVGGVDGYNTYRIPALIVASKGTLLAFCEGRKFWREDESPSDMVLRRSVDAGKSWKPMQVIVRGVPEAVMDPCVLIDRATGKILLVYDRWPELVKDHWPKDYTRKPGVGRDSITAWLTTSSDDGLTWTEPIDITATTKLPQWANIIHGPGVGTCMRSGRLLIPCSRLSPQGWWNFTIFSDDHGRTWQMGGTVGPGVDESQVVELADGTLLLNMRSNRGKGCRAVAKSMDGGITWSPVSDAPELSVPVCQASILRYSLAAQSGTNRILFSSPGHPKKRERLTVRVSYDEAKTWPVSKTVYEGYSGYSCLTVLSDQSIGCLFERDNMRKVSFARFTLNWLTDGRDHP